uniref:Phosphoglycerate mutase n=1 Tax=Pinguiococcus pyrenoidosus TaxID=172671 RepID=A0A7R9YG63_9STRA|mmetsp:Transcript_8283/g.31145  ORF Transcript_8283/g.31145 Transcript_8283/m.31145 type:complete len:761 (+) Transcript_8283:128-2410(+)
MVRLGLSYALLAFGCAHVGQALLRPSAPRQHNLALQASWQFPGFNRASWRKKPGTLILVRHGESAWNANYTFTGWADPDLSELGQREVTRAARLLLEGGYTVDIAYTSVLKRAISTTWILLRELGLVYLPVIKDYRLNERMYGALTGLSKPETARKYGESTVQAWRRSLKVRPPPLDRSHPYWPGLERKYRHLKQEDIPLTESLLDTMWRTMPLWDEQIKRDLANGKNVLVAAHANSLRGLMKHIDGISEEDIPGVHVPNCIPLVYKFDENMNPIKQEMSVSPVSGFYVERKEVTRAALQREAKLSSSLPGYDSMAYEVTPVLRALSTLQKERDAAASAAREAERAAERAAEEALEKLREAEVPSVNIHPAQKQDPSPNGAAKENAASGDRNGHVMDMEVSRLPAGLNAASKGSSKPMPNKKPVSEWMRSNPTAGLVSSTRKSGVDEFGRRRDPIVVMIRHGKTEYNKLGLFTGWEDAPLSGDGIEEARRAGRLMRYHGIEFDVIHASWLSRAIETAWLCLEELDETWIPIIKSWRLNERMYGALTGLSKKMIAQRHGQEQLKKWRRGYTTRPPPVSSFSQHYPGNDARYVENVKDCRYSVKESFVRSLVAGRLNLARKLPHTESLRDCMERTIPYYTDVIVPSTIDQGKNVLISSSENAIRGLLMHLCDIPPDRICDVEIPTGVPLLYDTKQKCIKLLEDPWDSERQYDFGAAGSEIFKPCDVSEFLNELIAERREQPASSAKTVEADEKKGREDAVKA